LIPVGFGYGDGDELFLRGWVWDSETRPRPALLPSLSALISLLYPTYLPNCLIFSSRQPPSESNKA